MIKGKHSSKKNELNKIEIGKPTDYRHLQHIGINSKSKNYDLTLNEKDESSQAIMRFFQESNLQCSKKDFEFAQDFIKQKGGIDEFKKQMTIKRVASSLMPPPPPAPALPPPPPLLPNAPAVQATPVPPLTQESDLMAQHQKSPHQNSNIEEDSRTNLLDSIKAFQGFSNKKTTHKIGDVRVEESNTIVDQLRRALEERRQVIKDSDDENENNNESSDSEW
jgi:hypothetical protein